MRTTALLASLYLLLLGCAPDEASPADDGSDEGIRVLWAALATDGGCSDPTYGDTKQVVVRLEGGGLENALLRVFDTSQTELVGRGMLLVDQVPAGVPFDLRLMGCNPGEGTPVWTGLSLGIEVGQNEKTTPFVFVTPKGKLACPTPSVLVGDASVGHPAPNEPGAFSAMILLPGGNLLVAGGARPGAGGLAVSKRVSFLHATTGTFVYPEGSLTTARAMATAVELSDGRIAVIGGTSSLGVGAPPSDPYLVPGPGAQAFPLDTYVEVVDPVNGAGTSLVQADAAGQGIAGFPLMAAVRYDRAADRLFIAGGYDAAGGDATLSSAAFRIAALSGGMPAVTLLALDSPRVGAVLLPARDGSVVVFGGNPDGDPGRAAEWIAATGSESGPLAIEGDVLSASPTWPMALQVREDAASRTWLLLGGIPAQSGLYPSSIDADFAVLLTVTSGGGAPKVGVKNLDLDSAPGFGRRVFGRLFHVPGTELHAAWGGLAGLREIQGFDGCDPDVDGQCVRNDLTLFSVSADGTLSLAEKRIVGPSIGGVPGFRHDGTLLLGNALTSLQGKVALGFDAKIWNPSTPADAQLCPSTTP